MEQKAGGIIQLGQGKAMTSPAKKRQLRIAVILLFIIISAAIAGVLLLLPNTGVYVLQNYETAEVYSGTLNYTAQGSGKVLIPEEFGLESSENGTIREVFVTEGDYVKKGAVLVSFYVADLQKEYERVKDTLFGEELTYKKLLLQNEYYQKKHTAQITSVNNKITDAEKDEKSAEQSYDNGFISKKQLNEKTSYLDGFKSDLQNLEDEYSENQAVFIIDDKLRQVSIEKLISQADELKNRIENTKLISPISGFVLEISSKLFAIGAKVSIGEQLLRVANPLSAVASLEVDEKYISSLKMDTPVLLKIGSKTVKGKIATIGRVAKKSGGGTASTITVRVKPLEPISNITKNSSVLAVFHLGEKQDVMLLPRGQYLITGSQRYVYVINGNDAIRTEVRFGEIQDETVEVISGLKPGDLFITSGYQNYIEFPRIEIRN